MEDGVVREYDSVPHLMGRRDSTFRIMVESAGAHPGVVCVFVEGGWAGGLETGQGCGRVWAGSCVQTGRLAVRPCPATAPPAVSSTTCPAPPPTVCPLAHWPALRPPAGLETAAGSISRRGSTQRLASVKELGPEEQAEQGEGAEGEGAEGGAAKAREGLQRKEGLQVGAPAWASFPIV